MVGKEYRPTGTQRFQFTDEALVTLGMRNNGEKDIQTFRGTVRLVDQFEKEIASNSWTYDRLLAAGATAQFVWSVNTFGEGRRLRDLTIEQFRFAFEPIAIIFADGLTARYACGTLRPMPAC